LNLVIGEAVKVYIARTLKSKNPQRHNQANRPCYFEAYVVDGSELHPKTV